VKTKNRTSAKGAFTAQVIRKAEKALLEYCKEDGIPKREYSRTLRLLKKQEFVQFDLEDWFLIWDAVGTRADEAFRDAGMGVFCQYAMLAWSQHKRFDRKDY
jgi:hypothetical protein